MTDELASRGQSFTEPAAALRDGEWEDNENEEDNFEKTFASGTILTPHFWVSERRRRGGGAGDLDAASDSSVPESESMITSAFFGIGVGVGGHHRAAMRTRKLPSKLRPVLVLGEVNGGPATAAASRVSGNAILTVSRAKQASRRPALISWRRIAYMSGACAVGQKEIMERGRRGVRG